MGHKNWKEPRNKKEKRFKEERPKIVRPTQNDAWKALQDWAWQIRRETYLNCGVPEKDIPPLFFRETTNYYDKQYRGDPKKGPRNSGLSSTSKRGNNKRRKSRKPT